jgi:glycosyltransferase involved in cell wall biosynthesis
MNQLRMAYLCDAEIPSTTANSIQIMRMCEAFVQEGWSIDLYAPRMKDPRYATAWEGDIASFYGLAVAPSICWLPRRRGLRGKLSFLLASLSRLRRGSYQLVYTRDVLFALGCVWLGYWVILETHFPAFREGLFKKVFTALALRSSRLLALVCITGQLAAEYREFAPQAAKRILVAPDGAASQETASSPPQCSRNRLLAGYAGSLYAGKGAELVCRLAALRPDLSFRIVGGSAQQVETLRNRYPHENIDFVGHVAPGKALEMMRSFDVALLPNQPRVVIGDAGQDIGGYTSPLKLFEYMSLGLPIVASDLPVLREAVSRDEVLLVPPDDLSAWSRALTELQCEEVRAELGAAARARFEREYSWRRRARKIIAHASMR